MDKKRKEALEAAEELVMELYRSDCPNFDRVNPCVKCHFLMRIYEHIRDELIEAYAA